MENIFSSFDYSGQGLSVQRQRLSAVAKNIANANTTKDEEGKVYQREIVVVRGSQPRTQFANVLVNELPLASSGGGHINESSPEIQGANSKIVSGSVSHDTSPARLIHDPSHPDADAQGYVKMPNVNIVTEMVDMITAQRSFEANTNVISAAKNMAKESIEI